jgi:Family of unknown function (DUF6093)
MTLRAPVPSQRARNYVKKMALAQMTSQVAVTRPGAPTFDADTGLTTAHSTDPYWTGPARIYSTTGGIQVIGEGVVSLGQTTIAISQDAPLPKIDDIVEVTSSPDDPAMVGRFYRVIDVSEGGLLSPTRNLQVTTVEGNPWSV